MAVPNPMDLTSPQSPQSKPSPSSHRLPTVAASQALQSLHDYGSKVVSTGLEQLDGLLAGGSGRATDGGFERGKVTEIWGPVGAGKTALALQAAGSAIRNGSSSIWVDAAGPISKTRLQSVCLGMEQPSNLSSNPVKKLHHTTVSTLSHLLAMIVRPRTDQIPHDVSVLVIDRLDTLINLDYPRYQTTITSSKPDQQKWQAGRRYAVLGSVVSTLNKLAVLHNMVVLVTTSCSTRWRADNGLGAALIPGVGGAEWDGGVWHRLVVFRDFSGRFVGVQKCQGKSLVSREEVGEVGKLVGFEISDDGRLHELGTDKVVGGPLITGPKPREDLAKPPKRSFDEIADSEDEDVDEYGWIDADEHALVLEGLPGQSQPIQPGTSVCQ